MLRRWREEIWKHEYDYRCENLRGGLAPLPPTPDLCGTGLEPCHCYRGMGFMRKRRPLDCGKTRCGSCHYEKFYLPKHRREKRLAAIDFEFAAS